MNSDSISLTFLWFLICGCIGSTIPWNIGRNRLHEYLRNRTHKATGLSNMAEIVELRRKGFPPALLPEHENIPHSDASGGMKEISKFMFDVFDMFDQDHSLQPTSNIIRSFHNVAKQVDRESFNSANDGCSRYPQMTTCRRKYMMQFNVSQIPIQEMITRAELRFRYLTTDTSLSEHGSDVDIKVEHLFCGQPGHHSKAQQCDSRCNDRRLIRRRSFTASTEGWLTFDVTHLLRRWSGSKCFQKIEVDLLIVNRQAGMVQIDTSPMSPKEPLLVVFSDDPTKNNRFDKQYETNNLIAQEEKLIESEENRDSSNERRRRSVNNDHKIDIKMDGIKIGVKHRTGPRRHTKSREKRSFKTDSCHKEEMEINFSKIGYDHILNPRYYQAYKCVGRCTFPITKDTTNHAIFHATMHYHESVEQPPCCVPTSLGAISMLFYYEETDVVEFIYEYPEMTVQECGCR